MNNSTPSSANKHHESTEPKFCQTAKMFFFLLQTELHDSFTITVSNAPANRFFTSLKSPEAVHTGH